MTQPPTRWLRLARRLAIGVGILALLLYVGLPVGLGLYALSPGNTPVGSPPPGFDDVTLRTDDGVELGAWYHPPASGTAILLIHGAGGSREGLRPYAAMLAEHGYGVLALDLRGHGASQGRTNRFGWQGTRDVGAAVAFLEQRPEVERLGGLGLSLGGEVLLGAAEAYPALQAIAADGATQRCTAELLALESERPLVRNATARVMYTAVALASGEPPPEPLLEAMAAARDTTFLLIAGGNDTQEVAFNQLFQQTVGERATLWVAPGAEHTGAFSRYPAEYEARLIAFFDGSFSR